MKLLIISCSVLALCGCATSPGNHEPLRPGETVYLVGPEDLIESVSDPERDASLKQHPGGLYVSGVALGWFDEVQVVENKGGVVNFSRSMARHGATEASAPESAFRRASDFLALQSWPTPGTYSFCNRLNECYSLHVSADATFMITQAPHPDTVCALSLTNDFNKCKTTGKIYVAPGYLEMRGTGEEDIKDFFVDYGGGKLCRIGYSVDFFVCDPNQVMFKAD